MMKKYPDATFIIVSDHGFGKPEKYFYINNALYNAGYLKTSSDPSHSFNSLIAMLFDKFSKVIFHLVPMQQIVRSSFGRKFILSQGSDSSIDFSKTKAFYHSVCSRGIRINSKGKYENGVVEKDEYENLRNELIDFLKSINDPSTGEPIVENIYKGEEIYGENAVNDPLDIVFDLKENYGAQELIQPTGGLRSFVQDETNLSEISEPGFYDWIGDHRPYGILFMYGKNIKPGKEVNANIVDIVPTILASLNQPIPDYIDGKVISDAFVKKPKVKKMESPKSLLSDIEMDRIAKLRTTLKK
jgi:predicted AlkP superfamily phosphohydrolase/phosphomutase